MDSKENDYSFSGTIDCSPEQAREMAKALDSLAAEVYTIYIDGKPALEIKKKKECPEDLFKALTSIIINALTQ